MKKFDVTGNASYLTHKNHARLRQDAETYFAARGLVLWSLNPYAASPNVLQAAFEPIDGIEQAVTQADVDAFMLAHDNSGQTESQLVQTVQEGALGAATAIPGWATWTAIQAGAWAAANLVNPLALIKTDANNAATFAVMKPILIRLIDLVGTLIEVNIKMGRLLIALRNREWPHMEGSE